MIGNGLDIHFGLPSKYTDFYEWLKNNPDKYEDNNLISDILDNIYAKEIDEEKSGNWNALTDWSDFEKELKRNLEFISKDKKANKIASRRIQELEEVSLLLREYLQNEEKSLMPQIEFNSELSSKSLSAPFLNLPSTHILLIRNRLQNTFAVNSSNKFSGSISFIDFNYTGLLSKYIQSLETITVSFISDLLNTQNIKIDASIFYPNGAFDDTPELGIGTEMDIPDGLELSQDEIDFLSKESFARRRMDGRVEEILTTIKTSDIIITYGLSLGESDALYIHKLVSTLIENKNSTAILIMFDPKYKKSNHGFRYLRKITEIRNKVKQNFQHINQTNENEIDIDNILNERLLVLFDNGLSETNDPKDLTYFPFKNIEDKNNKKSN